MEHDVDADERAPLLNPPGPEVSGALSNPGLDPSDQRRASRPTATALVLIAPLALLIRTATLLPTTTTLDVLQQLVCRRYHGAPRWERLPDALCASPEVEAAFASLISWVALMDGIGALAGCAIFSAIAARHGRRVALAVLILTGLAADAWLLASATFASPKAETPLVVLWLVCASFSQASHVAFIANVYLVDLVDGDSRTAALSTLAGWSALGSVISFSAGGTITTRGGNPLTVYVVAATLWSVGLLYVWLLLPESFPKAKRDELRAQRQDATTLSGNLPFYLRWRWLGLGVLTPIFTSAQRDAETGKRSWPLLVYAAHMLVAGIGGGYALPAVLTLVTSVYRYTPAETGYVLTALGATQMVVLGAAVPVILRALRAWYAKPRSQSGGRDDDAGPGDRLDVRVAIASYALESAAYVIFSFTRTHAAQLAAIMLVGCGAGYAPAVRSLVAASVPPLKQGETLGAIEVVFGLGLLLSPLVMGRILSATIVSAPQTVFFVQAGIVLAAAGMLLLVKEKHRYHE